MNYVHNLHLTYETFPQHSEVILYSLTIGRCSLKVYYLVRLFIETARVMTIQYNTTQHNTIQEQHIYTQQSCRLVWKKPRLKK